MIFFNKKNFIQLILILVFSFYLLETKAQNGLRFSQYMFNEIIVNPAYTGTKNGMYANFMYRKQWTEIEGAPLTRTFAFHLPVSQTNTGIGFALFNDEIGINKDMGILFNYAYRIIFGKSILSFGLQTRLINKNIRWTSLTAVKENNDPAFSQSDLNKFTPNFGLGGYWYNETFYIGLSVPRFIAGEIPTEEDFSRVDAKNFTYYFTSGFLWRLTGKFFIKPASLLKYTFATPAQFDMNLYAYYETKKTTFSLGFGYHSGDSFIASIGLQFDKNFEFSYAYDFTNSDLANFAGQTHELVLSYRVEFTKNRRTIISPRYF